jgi:hypothetical protein
MSQRVAGWSRSLVRRRSLLVRRVRAATLRQLVQDTPLWRCLGVTPADRPAWLASGAELIGRMPLDGLTFHGRR